MHGKGKIKLQCFSNIVRYRIREKAGWFSRGNVSEKPTYISVVVFLFLFKNMLIYWLLLERQRRLICNDYSQYKNEGGK